MQRMRLFPAAACAGLLLCAGGLLPARARASAAGPAEGQFCEIDIHLKNPKTQYFRGTHVPVEDLFVTLSVTSTHTKPEGENREGYLLHVPRPQLGPDGNLDFHIRRVEGHPGETEPFPGETPQDVGQCQTLTGTETDPFPIEETLAPGERLEFDFDIGRAFELYQAGRYEMSATFQGADSLSTVTFEILPIRRLDFRFEEFEQAIATRQAVLCEQGYPDYPYMFFIVPYDSRFDEILYVKRRGARGVAPEVRPGEPGSADPSRPTPPKARPPLYETYHLCRVPHRVVDGQAVDPKLAISAERVAIAVESITAGGGEATEPGVTDVYTIDFSTEPIDVQVAHQPGSVPATPPPP